MRLYLKYKKDKNVHSETEYKKGKLMTRYFYLYCDVCGTRSPQDYVNLHLEEEWFGNYDLCENCKKDLYLQKNRKCQQCKKTLKNFEKVVKLYSFDKTSYFCNHKCYYKYVKLQHPKSKLEWDKKFNTLSSEQQTKYRANLRKVRKVLNILRKDFKDKIKTSVPENELKYAYAWMRPRY